MWMLNKMFAVVLTMTPWAVLCIGVLMLLRRAANQRLSPRFFQLAFLIVALRLALPMDLSLPDAPVQLELPAVARSYVTEPADAFPEIPLQQVVSPESQLPKPTVGESDETAARTEKPVLPMVWGLGAVAFLTVHLASYGQFCRSLRKRRQWAEPSIQRLAQQELGRPLPVYWVEELTGGPMLVGLLRPVVYLPKQQIQRENLPYVLAHEACHAQRLDLPSQFLMLLAQSIHWFNPLVHWMARLSRQDMERSCDETVLNGRDLSYRKAYGKAVLDSLRSIRKQQMQVLSTGFSSKQDLKRRFQEMFDFQRKSHGRSLLALLLAVVVSASMLVACKAQPEPDSSSSAASFVEEQTGDDQSSSEPASQPEAASQSDGMEDEENLMELPPEGYSMPQQPEAASQSGTGIENKEQPAAENAPEEESAGPHYEIVIEQESKESASTVPEELPAESAPAVDVGDADAVKTQAQPAKEQSAEGVNLLFPLKSEDFKRVSGTMSNIHKGVDFQADQGSAVLAAHKGTVLESGNHFSYGNYVEIQGEDGLITRYAHCDTLNVKKGDAVEQGAQIATVGNTGNATGDCLHFEVRKDGTYLDPEDYVQPPKA